MKEIIILFLFAVNLLFAQSWEQTAKVVASDRGENDYFGNSVSISGNYAFVGAPYEDEDVSGSNTELSSGSIYIYEVNEVDSTWLQLQKITAQDRAENDFFGYSATVSGSYAIVGAPYEDEDASGGNTVGDAGSAYILKLDEGSGTWSEVQKIVASDRQEDDHFGYSVSISGSYAVVGVRNEDEDILGANTLLNAGSAYIFKLDEGSGTWSEVQKITAGDRAESDYFGMDVSIAGDYIVIGAPYEDEDAAEANTLSEAGSVYIFGLNETDGTWSQMQKVTAFNRAEGDYFGISVSISDSYIIAGAYREDEDASEVNTLSEAGSSYIFELNNAGTAWMEMQKIVASDRAASDNFGRSVSISGGHVIVGSIGDSEDENGANTLFGAGSAYIYELNEDSTAWNQEQKIVASDRGEDDKFGFTSAISGNYAIAGAMFNGTDAAGGNTLSLAGSAYIFVNNAAQLPVELTSFDGVYDGSEVMLEWETATEVNNYGFEVERQYRVSSSEYRDWENVGFVEGHGSVNTPQSYSFTDTTALPSVDTVSYRLKQVDIDGTYEYSKAIDVIINNSSVTGLEDGDLPTEFGLSQNYPNPFNPTTSIEYRVSSNENVSIKVYNMLGQEVMTLVNEMKSPGTYNVKMNGSQLASGVYIYQMTAGSYSSVKKFVLMK